MLILWCINTPEITLLPSSVNSIWIMNMAECQLLLLVVRTEINSHSEVHVAPNMYNLYLVTQYVQSVTSYIHRAELTI